MQLQSDVSHQLASGSGLSNAAITEGSDQQGMGGAGNAGVLNNLANI